MEKAISLQPGAVDLYLAGPYKIENYPLKELSSMDRIHGIEFDIFHEGGFVAQSYIHANETINSTSVSQGNDYGTFIFLTDNNLAVSYKVTTKMEIHHNSCRETVSDSYFLLYHLFANACDELNEMRFKEFYNNDNLFDTHRVRQGIEVFLLKPEAKKKEEWPKKPFLLHQACRLGMALDDIKKLVSLATDVKETLLRKDHNGWTPLHHVCRYQAVNINLISYLIERTSEAVLVSDDLGRCPLHIAVDSGAQEDVIRKIIDAEEVKAPLTSHTKYLEQNPLHIALNRGASEGVIKILLESDSDNLNVQTKSKTLSLPLHIALEKESPYPVIKMLLLHHEVAMESKSKSNELKSCDIYETLDGRFPRKYF